MDTQKNQWELFGFDLTKLWRLLGLGVRQVLYDESSWCASAFQPPLWVKSGDQWESWSAVGRGECVAEINLPTAPRENRFFAAAVPEDAVLFKNIRLPQSEEFHLLEAMSLEIAVSSPFPEAERIAGWKIVSREQSSIDVLLAISSKSAADNAMSDWVQQNAHLRHGSKPALCTVHPSGHLIEFPSYIDPAREASYLRRLRNTASIIVAIAICACLILAMPVGSSAYRAARLEGQNALIRDDAAVIDRSIDRLHRQRAVLELILDDFQSRPDHAARLESVASTAPDGTFLEAMTMSDSEIEVTGYSTNAAEYMRLLTEQDQYTDVSARSAFLREPRTGLERFTIDWTFVAEAD